MERPSEDGIETDEEGATGSVLGGGIGGGIGGEVVIGEGEVILEGGPSGGTEEGFQVLRDYFPDGLLDLVDNVIRGLDSSILPPIDLRPDPVKNREARSVNEGRRRLRDFLTDESFAAVRKRLRADDPLAASEPGIYDRIVAQHEFGVALDDIELIRPNTNLLPFGSLTSVLGTRPIEFTAILEVDVGGPEGGGQSVKVESTVSLRGYGGPTLSASQRTALTAFSQLVMGGPEHVFRLGLLRAECHMGQREFRSALDAYLRLLGVETLDEASRGFVAIRAGFAHLALGDERFRSARSLTEDERAATLRDYEAAVAVLDEHEVAADDSVRAQIVAHAEQQTAKLTGHFNVLGYRDSFVPVQRHEFLRSRVDEHRTLAEDAANKFEAFLLRANQLEDLEAELLEEVKTARLNEGIAAERVAAATGHIDRARTQAQIIASQQDFLLPSTVFSGFGSVLVSAGPFGAMAGLTSTVVGFAARSEELRLQGEMAETDRRIAEHEAAIARLEAVIARLRREFVERRLTVTGGRRLNKDLFYALARTYEELARTHLDTAIRFAYLYERAVAYFLGRPDLSPVRFDYASGEGEIFSAADELESDVSAITSAFAADDLPKRDRFIEEISLRESYPIEFSNLLQTGAMQFVISLYDLDKRRPGSYQGRLVDVAVELRGLLPPTGFAGNLTHMGRFLVRDRDSTLDPPAERLIPTEAELQEALARQERGEVAVAAVGGVVALDLGPDTKQLDAETTTSAMGSSQVFTLDLFEGFGPAGLWRLELDPDVLRSLTDVLVRLQIEAFETDIFDLGPKVKELIERYEAELAAGDTLDRILAVSLRQRFPDAFFGLAAGPGTIDVSIEDFPGGVLDPKVKAVVALVLDGDGRGVPGIGLEISKPDAPFILARTTGTNGFSEDVTAPFPFIDRPDRFPTVGDWTVGLLDQSQFAGLGDVQLFFIYEFEQA